MAQIKVHSQNHKIIETGSVIQYEDEPIVFSITDEEGEVLVRIKFVNDDDKMDSVSFNYNLVNEKEAELTLVNFKSVTGFGTKKPIEIGELEKRRLYLAFSVQDLGGNKSRLLHYTWYEGEVV